MQQIGGAGLQPVGLGIQRPRADPHGLISLVVTQGVVAHLCRRHLDEGVRQAQLRQQLLLHHFSKRGVQASGRQVAEQTQARVGVQPLGAGRVVGFPVTVVGEQGCRLVDLVGELQGQAASAVGAEVEQGDAIECRALQLRPVLAGRIVQ
ncbi:hypothetical protein D3C81_1647060 [compost metagenome]